LPDCWFEAATWLDAVFWVLAVRWLELELQPAKAVPARINLVPTIFDEIRIADPFRARMVDADSTIVIGTSDRVD